ncbi:MAG: ABC transporter substrate-binding protein [Desulfobulbaceae bacterium]|nr:ABC transporter substrate-binding protein [Desulfobulbaceae bacterium]
MRLLKIHLCFLAAFIYLTYGSSVYGAEKITKNPVIIGFDGEIGHRTSTSDDAVIAGIKIAIRKINDAGGVLGGRPLELLVKDNRSVPARGVANMEAFARVPDLVAVVGGKFSPVMLEQIPIIHEKKIILLDAWGAADTIIDNGRNPNFCFRLSLKDSWAIQTMMEYAMNKGVRHIGVLLPVTGWGRSNEKAIRNYLESHAEISLTSIEWYNLGDISLIEKYEQLRKTGAEAIFLIANEKEGSILVKEVARLPLAQRLPFISHWGVSGGAFVDLTGGAIKELDFSLVQTYSFFDNRRKKKLAEFYAIAKELFGIEGPGDIPSPVGTAHAYDLTHILALAINLAGSTERAKIRDSLEQVRDYDGLIKFYPQPFTETRHEALLPEDLFMGYFREDGAILRLVQ